MAAKQNKSPKVLNAGKKKRIVANPKPLNRTGGGKPQERRITNAAKVLGTQKALLKEAMFFLPLEGTEVTPDAEQHLEYLIGLNDKSPLQAWFDWRADAADDDMPSVLDIINGQQLMAAQRAFYKACKIVPDSEFIFEIQAGKEVPAVRGRSFEFFTQLTEQDKKKAEEEATRRKMNRNRPQGNRGAHPSKAISKSVPAPVKTSANVAFQVAKASGLTV